MFNFDLMFASCEFLVVVVVGLFDPVLHLCIVCFKLFAKFGSDFFMSSLNFKAVLEKDCKLTVLYVCW